MKKYVFSAILSLLCCVVFTSCEKDEIGGTATQNMAGQWYVTIDAVDDAGNPIDGGEDYFGVGRVMLLTYNTAANDANQMWIDDQGNFDLATYYDYGAYPNYSFKNLVAIDQNALTFSSSNATNHTPENGFGSEAYGITIEGGKILKGAGHQNNGAVCDSIVFFVKYEGDPWYPDDGYAKYKVSGVRYSGLEENN
jgi:hypothetical protein